MTERTKADIQKEIEALLELEAWTHGERVDYEALIEEYGMEGPADALAVSEWDDRADACTNGLNFN